MTGKKLSEDHARHISEGKIAAFKKHEEEHEYELPKSKICSKCKKRKKRDQFLIKKKTLKSGIRREYLSGECRKCANKRAKRWRDKHKAQGTSAEIYRKYERNRSPESKAKQRQANRENDAIKRRDQGMKSRAKPEPESAGKRLPREPFITWLKEEMDRRELTEIDLANLCGIDNSRIYKIVHGQEPGKKGVVYTRISLSTVDKILVGLDRHEMLTILYPDEEVVNDAS